MWILAAMLMVGPAHAKKPEKVCAPLKPLTELPTEKSKRVHAVLFAVIPGYGTGKVDVTVQKQTVFETSELGAINAWLVVDVVALCESGDPPFEVVVTLLAPGDTVELPVRFGAGS